jgi:nucleotide-binding universal stress UspA family protein
MKEPRTPRSTGPRRTARRGATEQLIRRIVVAADTSAHGRAALEAAVRLAARLEAELEGLFVEDVNLKRLAGLPVGREIRFGFGAVGRDTGAIADDLRAEAANIRRALESAALAAHVKATFRVAEGRVAAEVVAAGSGADLLVLGRSGRRIGPGISLGGTALAAIMQSSRSVLVLRPGVDIARRALVLYDGTLGADKAVDIAAELAADDADSLTVIVRAGTEAEAAKLRRRAAQRLMAHGQAARFRAVPEPTLAGLCRTAGAMGASVLVISGDDPLLEGEGRRRLLEDVACPVLLVR